MTRTFLIASVAALALTAPAQAERNDRQNGEREQKAEAQKAQASERRAKTSVDRGQTKQRAERSSQPRARAQERSVERRASPRMEKREPAAERRVRAAETGQARPQVERRARSIETRSSETRRARPQFEQRTKAVENRARVQERTVERQAKSIENRTRVSAERAQARAPQRLRQQERQVERTARVQQRTIEQHTKIQDRADARRATLQGLDSQRVRAWQDYAGRTARFDNDDARERVARQRVVTVGQRIDPDWYDDYAPLRYRTSYNSAPDYYYRYDDDDGYLYQVRRDSNLVTALFPLLGGAYSVGQPLPYYQQSYYNVPLGYRSLYYDTPDQYYRYGDGAIYQVDPGSQLIQGIVALLTGQNFGIGQQMPLGYDVYNVPYAYRSSYYDTNDMYYRYDDGYIYGFDPHTRMIESSYPLSYGGYAVGYPVPAAYPGYDYNVPNYYNDLYYDAPGYDYRYANNGIYQVDPSTQLVAALVALVTGQNFGVGQQMPMGYDAYNVPYAYRDRYYDTDQFNYRYADGYIYQVDPQTRMIQSVIDAIV